MDSAMDRLSKEELRYLFEKRDGLCVSIFLPTHRAGREIQQDSIRLKNLLRDAEGRLLAHGLRRIDARGLLSPAQQLLDMKYLWESQGLGLAVFLAPGLFRYFRLPLQFQELALVAERFHVNPLLPLWVAEDRFYLLAFSRNRARLFEGTRYTISELDVKGIPRSLSEALEYGVDQSQRRQHTMIPGLPKDILLYFRGVDKGLQDLLRGQRVPLVLAGVEEAFPLYRQVNTYAGLLDHGIPGNPDRLSATELRAAAQKIVQAYYDRVRNQALAQYREEPNARKTSKELGEILPAAYEGRVYHLFVASGAQQWGSFDPSQNVVTVHGEAQTGDENLLNLLTIQAILHGGSVYTVMPSDMPDNSLLAAVFRY